MNKPTQPHACWSTTSFGQSTAASPLETSNLGDHVDHCDRGRMHELRCTLQRVNGFVAARLMTSVAVLALLVAAVWTSI